MRTSSLLLVIAPALPFFTAACEAPRGFISALWYPNRDQAIPAVADLRETLVALDSSDPREEKLIRVASESASQVERDLEAAKFLRGDIVFEANESLAKQISEARELTADILFWVLVRDEGLGSSHDETNSRVQRILDDSSAAGAIPMTELREVRKYAKVLARAGRL